MLYTRQMSARCYRCFRKADSCLCKYVQAVQSGMKFVFLMHTKEAKRQKTGTGHLSHITLTGSELIVGVDFTHNARVNAMIENPAYCPLVLYPGTDAYTAGSPQLKAALATKTPLVFVIDGTWFCAKKIMDKSLNLRRLPRLSFNGSYRSMYTFKREPRPECVSTIESCYYLIKEMQAAGMAAQCDPQPLLTVFKAMVRHQLEAENRRIDSGLPSRTSKPNHYTVKKEIPSYLYTD